MASTQLPSGKLLLSWKPPEDTGDREDITYNVECQRCDGPVCQTCGEKIRYEPGSVGLTDTKVLVSQLDAHLNYTFTVEALSGVSQVLEEEMPSSTSITTSVLFTGEQDQQTQVYGASHYEELISLLMMFFIF